MKLEWSHSSLIVGQLSPYSSLFSTSLLFPKIIACLTEMRTMNEEYTKQVMQIQDIQPELSPLILEVVSQDS